MNVRNSRIAAVAAVLSGLIALTSCQQFFTSSLAAPLARASYAIPSDLPVADAIALLDEALASGDTVMAGALVTPLLVAATAAYEADPAGAAYQEAAGALFDAVVLSSGVGLAVSTLATALATIDPENPDEAAMTVAMSSLSAVSLTDDEESALLMMAAAPPASMSADDAYTAAMALMIDAYADAGASLTSTEAPTAEQQAIINADQSMLVAMALMLQAQALVDAGESSMIGSLGIFTLVGS